MVFLPRTLDLSSVFDIASPDPSESLWSLSDGDEYFKVSNGRRIDESWTLSRCGGGDVSIFGVR